MTRISTLTFSLLAAISTTVPALAQTLPSVVIATGDEGERYNRLCADDRAGIKKQMDRSANVECKVTGGSYQNADLLDAGQVDAALLQANVKPYWEEINKRALPVDILAETHKEVVQIACLDGLGVSDLEDLAANKHVVLAIGGDTSGHQVTWFQMVSAKPELNKVAVARINGDEALMKILDGTEINCLLQTTGIGGKVMMDIDQISDGKISLVESWDDAFLRIKDAKGNPLFSKARIEEDTYPHIQHGLFSSAYDVAAVPALLVVSKQFSRKLPRTGQQLRDSAKAAVAQIH
jgi:TRAP-type uncharacterized transport system substrate-binding protein